MEERIRFSIKGPEGVYRGEAKGQDLRNDAVYEVQLSTGERFHLRAVPDSRTSRYNWISSGVNSCLDLVPVVGGIIERYFKRLKKKI